jgi:alanine dehydrogenase
MVIGGGVVGMNAAFIAIGMEADVYVFDRTIDRLRELDIAFGGARTRATRRRSTSRSCFRSRPRHRRGARHGAARRT